MIGLTSRSATLFQWCACKKSDPTERNQPGASRNLLYRHQVQEELTQFLFINLIGGFLAVTVEREGDAPVATFRHYSVDGEVLNEDRREVQ